jgi:hypothetical protein
MCSATNRILKGNILTTLSDLSYFHILNLSLLEFSIDSLENIGNAIGGTL